MGGQGTEDGEAVDGQATHVADSLMALARKLGAKDVQKGVCEKCLLCLVFMPSSDLDHSLV